MTPILTTALIATLAAMLCATSAAAGALWRTLRSGTPAPADLDGRLKAIESTLARIEAAKAIERQAPPIGPTRRFDRPEPATPSGPTLIAVPDLAAPAADEGASSDLGRRFGAIWDLADAGAPAEAIARATGQPIGQVELILGLRRQLATSGGGRG